MTTEKFCVKCGKKFIPVGREILCPACKAAAAEESKRAAVLKAKRASWNGESVPVRISGRASTVIRAYGAEKSLPFAAALDDLLKSSSYFKGTGSKWEDVTPYKSRRRDKHTTETTSTTETPQEVPQEVTKAAKTTSKTSKRTTAGKGEKKA